MIVEDTDLDGVKLLKPARFGDTRGFFSESWNKKTMEDHGFSYDFVQDNHSFSSAVGTVRGLHFQAPPFAQDKLVRCGRGRLLDVAVDIRNGSPTFGQSVSVELSFENGFQLLVPKGFAHGFVTREPDTEIIYKCTDYYAPEADGAVLWNCPDIGIDWNLEGVESTLSQKDTVAPRLADLVSPFEFGVE